MAVIPGGLTPYLQAGDIGIYKSVKDRISPVINAWKQSDRVTYTRSGSPRPPDVKEVASWANQAWRDIPDDVVYRSIMGAGFSENFVDWQIASHDVYDSHFCEKWIARDSDDDEEDANIIEEFDDLLHVDESF